MAREHGASCALDCGRGQCTPAPARRTAHRTPRHWCGSPGRAQHRDPGMGPRSRTARAGPLWPGEAGPVSLGVQGEPSSRQGWSAGGEMTLEVGSIRDAASGSDPAQAWTPEADNRICAVGPRQASRRLMASAGQDGESPGVAANGRRGVRHRVRHGTEMAKGKYAGSSAEHLWRRLDSMDFINRGCSSPPRCSCASSRS